MKKIIIFSLALSSLFFVNCKKEGSMQDFKSITENYFKEKNELNPLDATLNGQNQYNGQFVFEMTDSYRKKQGAFFDKY